MYFAPRASHYPAFETRGAMSALEDPPEEVRNLSDNCNVLWTPEGIRLVNEYIPKDTDVILAGPPKSGTTWVQHIMHSLRSRGDMEYKTLSSAIPVLEYFERAGSTNIGELQKFQPNMFKSHLIYDQIPKAAAKHIIIVRNPSDVAVSRYHYFENWLYEKDKLTLEEFVEWFYLKPCPPYEIAWNSLEMRFIAKAYPHRHDDGVLWLHYDDLKADLKGCIKLISDFMGIGVGDQSLLNLVEHQASFEFMQEHKDKFDSRFAKNLLKKTSSPSPNDEVNATPAKLRKGTSGEGKKEISPEQLKALDARWKELVEPVCGCASFHEMREKINKELGRSFGSP